MSNPSTDADATVDAYIHRLATSGQEPDERPGHYYVGVIDAPARRGLLLGPVPRHAGVLAVVDLVAEWVRARDPMAAFYAFGTCRIAPDVAPPDGSLNDHLAHLLATARRDPTAAALAA